MYVDSTYYFEVYKGTELSTENVDKYLKKASRNVDNLTFNRINVDKLSQFQLNIIQQVICEYAEYLLSNDDEMALTSYSINGVSMSFDDSSSTKINGVSISKDLYQYLSQTGLCTGCLNFRA